MARLVNGSPAGTICVPGVAGPTRPNTDWPFQQALLDGSGGSQQLLVKIGDPIPLVFAKFRTSDSSGGVWLNPPAARLGAYGKQDLKTPGASEQRFATAMVISEGQTGAIASTDIYKGGYAMSAFTGVTVENRYQSIPAWDYSYYTEEASSTEELVKYAPPSVGTVTINGSAVNYFDYTFSKTLYVNLRIELRSPSNYTTTNGLSIWYGWRYQVYVNNTKTQSFGDTAGTYCTEKTGNNTFITQTAATPSEIKIRFIAPQIGGTGGCANDSTTQQQMVWTDDIMAEITIKEIRKQSSTVPPVSVGAGGSFKNITTLSVKGSMQTGAPWGAFDYQIQAFLRNGVAVKNLASNATESSDNFADIVNYMLSSVAGVSSQLIDTASLLTARTFTNAYDLRFNGALVVGVNLRQFLTDTALYFLCQLTQKDGKFGLRPLLPTNANGTISTNAVVPLFTFNGDNIVIGSFSKTHVATDRLRPFIATMKWRLQTPTTYNEEKAVTVQYVNAALAGPFEEYDMSLFCMSAAHATLAGKYILAYRKHVNHVVSFDTTELTVQLSPGDPIRVMLSWSAEGVAVSINALYQVTSILENPDGTTTIEADYLPVTGTGASQVAYDVLNAAFTVS